MKDYHSLKDLILCGQLKWRIPAEIREHLYDWGKIASSSKLIAGVDNYKVIHRTACKPNDSSEIKRKLKGQNSNPLDLAVNKKSGNKSNRGKASVLETKRKKFRQFEQIGQAML